MFDLRTREDAIKDLSAEEIFAELNSNTSSNVRALGVYMWFLRNADRLRRCVGVDTSASHNQTACEDYEDLVNEFLTAVGRLGSASAGWHRFLEICGLESAFSKCEGGFEGFLEGLQEKVGDQ